MLSQICPSPIQTHAGHSSAFICHTWHKQGVGCEFQSSTSNSVTWVSQSYTICSGDGQTTVKIRTVLADYLLYHRH